MKLAVSLSAKILLLALLNIVLLAFVLVLFARLQFRFDVGSFLLLPGRERIVSVSRLVALQLFDRRREEWTDILKAFERRYPAKFYLFQDDGVEIAGAPVTLPDNVLERLPRPRFLRTPADPMMMPPDGPPPPPPDGPPPPPPPPGQRGTRRSAAVEITKTENPSDYWAAVRIPIWGPERDNASRAVLVWQFSSPWTDSFYFDYMPWVIGISIVLLVSGICWLPLVRGLTSSITSLTNATQRIADGHFDVKLRTQRRDELGRLSESISRMAGRLAGYVYGQKRFLGDVAHELTSPIARMQMALGVLENRASECQASYVADLNDDLQQMSGLVNELLSFSKAQLTEKGAELVPVSVVRVVDNVLEREHASDEIIRVHIADDIEVLGYPEFVRRAVANVVRNAIRYAGHSGPIDISAVQIGDRVQIKVADCGPGIPESELENVFRPFYRPEFARTRETGGTGLGLAIVRDCIEACGGRVECKNRSPHGLEVLLELQRASARHPLPEAACKTIA